MPCKKNLKWKYDKLFFEQARLGFDNFSKKYNWKNQYYDLFDRKHKLNKEFMFSDENVKRLSDINAILQGKSELAYKQAERLEANIITDMQNSDPFISDYEIEFLLSFFAEQKYSHIPNLQGNTFFECKPIWFAKADRSESERKEHKDWLFKTDHTEIIHEGHPLYNFRHCYLFHDLIDHTILSYQDIVDIEDVWIEVVLTVQNFQSVS
jgi:hypothetical protein